MPFDADKEVLVCLGTGGVGKTTLAAALAVEAATRHKRVLVMTIDPARRLCEAFGLQDVGTRVQQIAPDAFAAAGLTLSGSLDVCMPDVRGIFDALVARWAPDPRARQRILDNRIYRHFASSLAGSHEYAAVESLYESHQGGRYDLIVVDTPPSQNVVAFLQAPRRIVDFVGSDALSFFLKAQSAASRLGGRLMEMGNSFLLKGLGKVAGGDTLRALVDFMQSFAGMYDGFVARAAHIDALLASPRLGYLLIGAPQTAQVHSLLQFHQGLVQRGFAAHGLLVNRVRPPLDAAVIQPGGEVDEILRGLPQPQREDVRQALQEEVYAAAQDRAALPDLRQGGLQCPAVLLPDLGPQASIATLALGIARGASRADAPAAS